MRLRARERPLAPESERGAFDQPCGSTRRAHRPGRKRHFDRAQYRERNIVERVIGWLKNLRRIASRAEKLAVRYAGMVTLALIARTAVGLSAGASVRDPGAAAAPRGPRTRYGAVPRTAATYA